MRSEPRLAPGAGRWPATAAIAFIAVISGSIWWESRRDAAPEFVPAAPMPVAKAPMKPAKAAAPRPMPAQVAALAQFAQKELPEDSPAARAAAADGMRLVAAAIAARGDSVLWRDRAKRLEEAAESVRQAPDSEQAAGIARDALVQAASWIAGLSPVRPAAGSPDAVIAAAESFKADQPLRAQAAALEEFFDAAARALGGAST